jgi:hypothetical protein
VQNNFKKIYQLLHSPILTPYNLLENVKLDNYSYVNYYKGEIGIICKMKCTDQNNTETKYYYYFDENDYLFKVLVDTHDGRQEEIYNRNSELQKEIDKYYKQQNKTITAI